jgi:hypothetical protein
MKGNYFIIIFILLLGYQSIAQVYNPVTGKHLYRPQNSEMPEKQEPDTIINNNIGLTDSLKIQHIQDSILARQLFIHDSILKHQKIVDSLNFLKTNLPKLLEAGLWSQTDFIIVDNSTIENIGDSTLSNYSYVILPLSFNQPFVPWVNSVPLSANILKVEYKGSKGMISLIKAPKINWSFQFAQASNVLVINEQSIVASKNGKNYYKQLFDSVFYNSKGKIIKIKKYANFFQSNASYQKGSFLFTHLYEVKQFGYNNNNTLNYYEVASFCDRWNITDITKVCTVVKYNIEYQNNIYSIIKMNDPANEYSDGKFMYEFDNAHNLKFVSFNNLKNTENWKTIIELNDKGHVSRYVYQVKGKVNNTLIFNYFLDDPKAKNRYEAISCTFEDDGISYYQKNLTTGKIRIRDHFTAEWGPWN